MSFRYPEGMRRLINELSKLPSVGERSATRLAYHLITSDRDQAELLAATISNAVSSIQLCRFCHFLSDSEVCSICRSDAREASLLCVVEKPADIFALERSGGFNGLYHVLHGVWSPLRGVRPEDTRLGSLVQRLRNPEPEDPIARPVTELIVATSTTVDGEATAMYIARELENSQIQLSRIGQGLPRGGELEYADEMTLSMSLEGRAKDTVKKKTPESAAIDSTAGSSDIPEAELETKPNRGCCCKLRGNIILTPVVQWSGKFVRRMLGENAKLSLKLELMQYAGSFRLAPLC